MSPDYESSMPNAFAAAVRWLDGTLLGTIATIVALLAVTSVGFLLMSGRIDLRRAAQVVFGCFIVFGASSIASGITRALVGTGEPPQVEATPLPSPSVYAAADPHAKRPGPPYDPYAGAAMPSRP
jgi:type IV secretion system protein VirB2